MPKYRLLTQLAFEAHYILNIIDDTSVILRSELVKIIDIERVLKRMLASIENFKQE